MQSEIDRILKQQTPWPVKIMRALCLVGACVLVYSCATKPAHASQQEVQGQGQGTTTFTTTGNSSVNQTGANDNAHSYSAGNTTEVGRTNSSSSASQQVQSQSQSQSQSGAHSGASSRSGNATTQSGLAQTVSEAASSTAGPATTASGDQTINANNTSRNRAYGLSLTRNPVHVAPMNCVESTAWEVGVLGVGGSRATSRPDAHCVRRIAIANACTAAQSLDLIDPLKSEHIRESAAALECADERMSGAFKSPQACREQMKYAVCPYAVAAKPVVVEKIVEKVTHEVRYLPAPVVVPSVAPVSMVTVVAKPRPAVRKSPCKVTKPVEKLNVCKQ